jgi:hypothetical protein
MNLRPSAHCSTRPRRRPCAGQVVWLLLIAASLLGGWLAR